MLGKAPLVYETGSLAIDTMRRELRVRGAPVPVGSRTFDIIEILVKSAGQLVTKDQLIAQVWPNAIVGDNTIQVHIHAIRKALGPDRGMLKTISGRGYRLLGDWHIRPHDAGAPTGDPPAALAEVPPATNLPVATADLIGRSQALQLLSTLATAYRIVTLTGSGGIGKSALASAVARSLLPQFDNGGWLVELASLSDPNLVPSAVAEVIGLRLSGGTISADAVAHAIGHRKLLVVLDNCEHLVDAAAHLAETIIKQCPNAMVLATSRESLRIDGEYVYRVPPLDIPGSVHERTQRLLTYSSVELFVARTRALNTAFTPDDATLPGVASICRHLDGIPLAIEFAAARAATLGVQQVLDGLRDRFSLLTAGRRTALPRHRTLRAVLDWSYDLLPDSERLLLRHLAVFAGGFTLEAAAALVHDIGLDEPMVVGGIANLVEKSLVARDRSEATGRWSLLETIRAYALEKLADHDELDGAMRRHATYFCELFEPTEGLSQEDFAPRIIEIDNIRAALDWCFSSAREPALGVALTVAYAPVWLRQSLVAECMMRSERALDSLGYNKAGFEPDGKVPSRRTLPAKTLARYRMQLLAAYASANMLTRGTSKETMDAWDEALRIAENLADSEFQLRSLWGLYAEHLTQGSCHAALASAERFRSIAVSTDQADILVGERMIGTALHQIGRQGDARPYIERFLQNETALSASRRSTLRFPFDPGVAARCSYARILWLQGKLDQAVQTALDAMQLAETLDQPVSLFFALFQAACPIALLESDLQRADSLVSRLHDLSVKHAMEPWRIASQCYRGMLLTKLQSGTAQGIDMIRTALSALPASAYHQHYAQIASDLADALGQSGEFGQALAVLDGALMRCDRVGEGWCVPELLRVKGELLIGHRSSQDLEAAANHFSEAIDLAARQGALSWELRAAMSLARLRMKQGRGPDGRHILAPVYSRFTEGFETADLRAARALLGSLRAQ